MTGSSMTAAKSGSSASTGTTPPVVGAGTFNGGDVSIAGLPATSPGIDGSSPSPDSTALLAQAMASFGSGAVGANSSDSIFAAELSQQSTLTAPLDPPSESQRVGRHSLEHLYARLSTRCGFFLQFAMSCSDSRRAIGPMRALALSARP